MNHEELRKQFDDTVRKVKKFQTPEKLIELTIQLINDFPEELFKVDKIKLFYNSDTQKINFETYSNSSFEKSFPNESFLEKIDNMYFRADIKNDLFYFFNSCETVNATLEESESDWLITINFN